VLHLFCITSDSIEIVASSIVVHADVGGDACLVCIAHSPSNKSVRFEWFSNNIKLIDNSDGIIEQDEFVIKNRMYKMSVFHRCNSTNPLTLEDNSKFECRASGTAANADLCTSTAVIDLVVFGKFSLKNMVEVVFKGPALKIGLKYVHALLCACA